MFLAEIGQDLNTVGDKGFTPQLAEKWDFTPDGKAATSDVLAGATRAGRRPSRHERNHAVSVMLSAAKHLYYDR